VERDVQTFCHVPTSEESSRKFQRRQKVRPSTIEQVGASAVEIALQYVRKDTLSPSTVADNVRRSVSKIRCGRRNVLEPALQITYVVENADVQIGRVDIA
jgi:hypothetical protein